MIKISPLRDFQKVGYIPSINELDSYTLDNNVTYILRDMDSDMLNPMDVTVIRKNDPEFNVIQSKMNNKLYPFSKLIKINAKMVDCSSGLSFNPNTSTYWSYIGKFDVHNELWIADPCYFKNSEMTYKHKIEDTFYAFCNIGDLNMSSSITDIVIINESMMHEYSTPIDHTIFDNNIESIMNLYVDSGCIVMCDSLDNIAENDPEFNKWYEKNVLKISQVGMLKTTEGVLTSSGFGDGAYPLYMYKNNGHVAYLVNFLRTDYEGE